MADTNDKLQLAKEKQQAEAKRQDDLAASYAKVKDEPYFKDLVEYFKNVSDQLTYSAKNRIGFVNNEVQMITDEQVLSLLYKAAGMDDARGYAERFTQKSTS